MTWFVIEKLIKKLTHLCKLGGSCLLQGANVTGNKVAGLVVNGTADVSITNSSFTNNSRVVWHGAAFVAGGNAAVHIAETVFADNWIYDNNPEFNGGVHKRGSKSDSAGYTVACPGTGASQSGLLLLLLLSCSSFHLALCVNCVIMTFVPAGALLLVDNTHVSMDNCTLTRNWATYSFGGSIFATDKATLEINNTLMSANVAT
jgi:hypothetical protein